MFIHNFKYTITVLLKNKSLIFWSFIFPLILGTLFKMAFSNITNSEKLDIIDIAIVNNEEFKSNYFYIETFKNLSDETNENQLFNTQYVTLEEAQELLVNNKIAGYMLIEDNKPQLFFNSNGIDQTVFKHVTDEILSTSLIVNNISKLNIEIDYSKLYKDIIESLHSNNINILDKSKTNIDFVMIEFYTLIAMTCLYGGMISMTAINKNLANMGNIGKRVEVSPTKKGTIILSSLLSSYLIQLLGLLILFIYTIFVLKVNYGSNLLLIILLALIGSLNGLALGLCVGVICRKSEGFKIGILLGITMLGSFLSGMMGITLKYVIDKNIPIINKINPISMITDGFYSLYYYNSLNRYYFNIISLLIVSTILIIISILSLRRQQYDSI